MHPMPIKTVKAQNDIRLNMGLLIIDILLILQKTSCCNMGVYATITSPRVVIPYWKYLIAFCDNNIIAINIKKTTLLVIPADIFTA